MRGLAAYKRLMEENTRLQRKLSAAREKLAKNCTHPDGYIFPYEWEHDNGYGRQTRHTGQQCLICFAKDPWKDGKFYARDQLTENWE